MFERAYILPADRNVYRLIAKLCDNIQLHGNAFPIVRRGNRQAFLDNCLCMMLSGCWARGAALWPSRGAIQRGKL